MKIAAESLLNCYSKNDLTVVELLRRTLEEETIADLELNKIVEFYGSDIKLNCLIFERQNRFSRCRGMGVPSTITNLRNLLAEEVTLKWMIPNLHKLCVPPCNYLRGRKVIQYVTENTQLPTQLSDSTEIESLRILTIHKNIVLEIEMEKLMDEFVDATSQRRKMFGPSPLLH